MWVLRDVSHRPTMSFFLLLICVHGAVWNAGPQFGGSRGSRVDAVVFTGFVRVRPTWVRVLADAALAGAAPFLAFLPRRLLTPRLGVGPFRFLRTLSWPSPSPVFPVSMCACFMPRFHQPLGLLLRLLGMCPQWVLFHRGEGRSRG